LQSDHSGCNTRHGITPEPSFELVQDLVHRLIKLARREQTRGKINFLAHATTRMQRICTALMISHP
jgi:hypothetical protein